MALGYVTTLRNVFMNALTTAIDAGAGAGFLRYYNGTKPAVGGAATTLIAELTFSDPAAAGAAAGLWTASAITGEASAPNAGTVTWARIVDSTGTVVADCTAGDVGTEDIVLDNAVIAAGQAVDIGSLTVTEGNP